MTGDEKEIIASVDLGTLRHSGYGAADFAALARQLFAFLILCQILLAAGHIWVVWGHDPSHFEELTTFFHLDREGNLPTWFSSVQFLLLAGAFAALYFAGRYRHNAALWLVCTAGAVFLSLDEASGLHELLGTSLKQWYKNVPQESFLGRIQYLFSYYWMMIYLPVVLPICAVILRVMARELGSEFRYVLLAAAIFFTGAVGLDYLEGRYGTPDHTGVSIATKGGTVWLDVALVEEMMEMFAVSLAITAFARHYAKMGAVSNLSP